DTASYLIGVNINRVLHRKAVRRSRTIRPGVSVPGDCTIQLRDDVRQPFARDIRPASRHFRQIRRIDLERSRALPDVMSVDLSDRGEVPIRGWANRYAGMNHSSPP